MPLSRINQWIIVAALIAAGAWLAHLHVVSQTYRPVVRLASPDGLTYTMVQDEVTERRACGSANDRFLGPIKESCQQCQVVFARCERKLEGLEAALAEGAAVPHYLVYAPGLRMAIAGPAAAARASCEFIAADMVKRGLRSAACLNPRPGQAPAK
jgi:hypothetical protein